MALLHKINKKAKAENNTGFGTNSQNYGGRFINKNGNANIQKVGIGFLEGISWYHTMLKIPRWKFFFIIILFYFIVNLFFASIYMLIGVENLRGVTSISRIDKFGEAFFFSIQTFTTVGYGHISPSGFLASFVAAVEALSGLLSFAIATGLFYGRFSKPNAYIKFSENALIAPYKDGTALMMRLAPHKNTNLTDAEAFVTVGILIDENGVISNKFYNLPLEMSKINSLTLSWTLVHPIDEESPLFNLNQSDYKNTIGEILVYIKTFDDMYSSTVAKRTSYTFNEVVYGAKFSPMYSKNESNTKTVLHLDNLNSFIKVNL
ncbi:ion channel [Flavobacterium sp.]|uniref:ion channel n=1 Tax=Flavobacterium sp. TaxID=239 RepID=UPI001B7241AF|nr:ion channel [Flavobacterium sp.]MBP6127846.1 Inward rectifier potassium channel Irk [Flavobacterium sp.]